MAEFFTVFAALLRDNNGMYWRYKNQSCKILEKGNFIKYNAFIYNTRIPAEY